MLMPSFTGPQVRIGRKKRARSPEPPVARCFASGLLQLVTALDHLGAGADHHVFGDVLGPGRQILDDIVEKSGLKPI